MLSDAQQQSLVCHVPNATFLSLSPYHYIVPLSLLYLFAVCVNDAASLSSVPLSNSRIRTLLAARYIISFHFFIHHCLLTYAPLLSTKLRAELHFSGVRQAFDSVVFWLVDVTAGITGMERVENSFIR